MKKFQLTAIVLLLTVMAAAPADLLAAKKTAKAKPVAAKPAKPKPTKAKPAPVKSAGSLAYIRMSGAIQTAPGGGSLLSMSSTAMTTKDWLNRLATARNDKTVKAVALEIATPSLGLSQAIELAEGIRKLATVKPVYTHTVVAGIPQYILASAGTDVALEPEGGLEIIGIGMELTFYGGVFKKYNITPQFIQIGDYKGACEPFVNSSPSKELQGEITDLADSLYTILVDNMALNRKLKPAAVRKAIDNGPFTSPMAKRFKLVDRLIPRQLWLKSITDKYAKAKKPLTVIKGYAKKKDKKLDLSNPFTLLKLLTGGSSKAKPAPANSIAIIYGNGQIVSGKGGASLFGGTSMGDQVIIKAFDKARTDKNIKAVVFRITSPGGSALASEMMYQAIKQCAKVKPVLVSVSSMAASGGYYIACGAHKIYSDEAAIIGSIGVVAGRVSLHNLLKEHGVGTWTVQRGKNAGMKFSRPWTKSEMATLKRHAAACYKTFTKHVKEARKGKVKDVSKVAQGRIFTARQALENGLIDEIGGIGVVCKAAYTTAKMTGKANYVILPKTKTFIESLMSGDDEEVISPIRNAIFKSNPQVGILLGTREGAKFGRFLSLLDTLQKEHMLMAMPYGLEVK